MMGIAIVVTSLTLVLVFVWMVSLSLRSQRLEQEKKARDIAYRKTIEKAREQEKQERVFKAETGHIPTILFLAKETERHSPREALYWYEQAAKQDNIAGMYGIVRICKSAIDDIILREKAHFWETAIAGYEGDLDALFTTGQALVDGKAVDMDIAKGIELITNAAQQSHIPSMLYMGHWYLNPNNVDRSPLEALHWFERAACEHSIDGQIQLGLCYLRGVGVKADRKVASYWLELAAEKGSPEAMYQAGMAWKGCGKLGNALAYIWLFMASYYGFEEAKAQRDNVTTLLGVDVVVSLQSVAKPLIRKISDGNVVPRSIIKALDKLYKRDSYLPQVIPENTEEPNSAQESAAGEESNDSAVAEDNGSAASLNSYEMPSVGPKHLDFSQSFTAVKPNSSSVKPE